LLTVGSLQFLEVGLGVVIAIVVSGFVASLSELARLAGLDSKVDFSGWSDLL